MNECGANLEAKMSGVYKFILDFAANTEKVEGGVANLKSMLKGAALAAGALFAADKVMDAAKAVADYAQAISGTTEQVKQLTGLSGKAAAQMAGDVTALGQAYDQDLTETLKASNVLMKSFGESSTEAFNLMNLGLSSTANLNGDLLQQITEYSPHFAEAGLAASEMFAVIKAGADQGVFDDKAADAIKEGSIRLREMTQSTKDALNGLGLSSDEISRSIADGSMTMFEAMQKVSTKLGEFPQQSPQVGAALADIFGGPGEDAVNFIRTLGDLDTSLDGLMEGATDAQRAQMEYTESLAEFHKMGAMVFGGTGELMTKLKTVGMNMVNGLIKGVVSVINYFIDLYNESAVVRGAFEAISFAVKTVFNYIGTMFKDLLNKFKAIGKVIKAVFTGDFKSISGIVQESFQNSSDIAADFGKKTAANFTSAVENTLNPRAKVALINFDAAAEEAGTSAGNTLATATAAQMSNAFKNLPAPPKVDLLPNLKVEEIKDLELPGVAFEMAAPVITDTQMLEGSLGAIANAMDLAGKHARGLGEDFDEAGKKKELLAEQIKYLIDNGLSPESMAVQQLREQYQLLAEDSLVAVDMTALVANSLQNTFNALGEGIGNMLAGTASAGDIFKMLIGQVADFGKSLGQSLIAAGIGAMSFKKLLANPAVAIAAGTALVALSAVVKSKLEAGPSGGGSSAVAFADGGIVHGPTMGLVGEYPGARSNPEVIAPLDKLRNMLGDRSGAQQQVQVEVIGSISGNDIRIAQARSERRQRQFGG